MFRGQYDIVHLHSSKAGIVGRLAARLAGTPVVVQGAFHLHNERKRAELQ